MSLIVETGAGLPNANAFITRDYAKAYWDARGDAYTDYSDEQIDAAIVRATDYLSESFTWKGVRTKRRDYAANTGQALEWPRSGVIDGDGVSVPDDVIPPQIKEATAELAFYELVNPGAFAPVHVSNNVVKTEKVGPLSITYDTDKNSAWGARPVMPAVTDLISEFLATGHGSVMAGQSVRM